MISNKWNLWKHISSGQGLVHKEERVFPITKDRIQSLPDLIEGDIHEQ